MDAAAVIRTARAGAGLSLRGLAGRAGTSHATLSAYEAGRVHPSIDTVGRIVGAAGYLGPYNPGAAIRGDLERAGMVWGLS